MDIQIHLDKCFFCGKKLDHLKKEKHHAIPRCINPKFNVIIPVHKTCHTKINKMYVSQQRKDPNIKLNNILEDTIVKLTSMHDKVKSQLGEEDE